MKIAQMLMVPDELDAARTVEFLTRAAWEAATEKRKSIQRESRLRCKFCNAFVVLGETEYIQTHWYTSPHGCTGGDYWNQGEGQWVCPNGHNNRLHDEDEVTALKELFKRVRPCYCEWNRTPCKSCQEAKGTA